jgi:hypothetical protein
VLRAGLTEILVSGIEARWIRVSTGPIGMPANPAARPAASAHRGYSRRRVGGAASIVAIICRIPIIRPASAIEVGPAATVAKVGSSL